MSWWTTEDNRFHANLATAGRRGRGVGGPRELGHRRCAVGIGDLVVAVGTGFLSSPSTLQQLALDGPNAAITLYPFVLIPTFLVPVSVVLHVYVIARLRRRSAAVG